MRHDHEEGVIESVPEEIRADAIAAFRQRESNHAVADLVADSLLEEAPAGPRHLVFARDDRRISVTVRQAMDGLRLEVCLTPPGRRKVQVRTVRAQGELLTRAEAETDEQGEVTLTVPAGELLSLLVRAGDSDAGLASAWVRY